MTFRLSLESTPQTEEAGTVRGDSKVPSVGEDLDAPGTERSEAHVARAESAEWRVGGMRWEIPAGPGKQFGFYLNYNTMLHGRFFSRYTEDPIHLC